MMNRITDYLDELFPDPKCELIYSKDYELLIAIVLSAQSTDRQVNKVTEFLFQKYPSIKSLGEAEIHDLERIIRPIGSFHKKALYVKEIANKLVNEYDGIVPRDRELLLQFPGVGRKTINVFFSEFYKEACFAVDTHVSRVLKRLGVAKKNDNVYIIEKKAMRKFLKEEWGKRHLQIVLFGRYYCKAIKPSCKDCKLVDICNEKKKTLI